MFDARAGAATAACDGLLDTFRMLQEKGRLDQARADSAALRIQACQQLQDLAVCHIVVEAIVEDLDAKKALFAQLEAIVGDDVILASNTSSLSVTAIAASAQHPERIAGYHFSIRCR
jgi:3-hydroxybutyryl-CoA dehydrogenase